MALQDVRQKKTVFKVGEDTFSIAFDLNAFAELEEIYGTLDKAVESMAQGKISALLNALWAGLLRDHNLTKKQAGELFDLATLQDLMPIIEEAINKASPQNNANNKGGDTELKNGQDPIVDGIGVGSTTSE